MRAVRFVGEGRHELADIPQPAAAPAGAALVEVARAGICGSDLHILSTPMRHPATPGIILGHEFAGTVVEVGDGLTHVRAGNRVAIQPSNGCGCCRPCRQGHPVQCRDPLVLGIFQDGGMTELAVVPGWAIYPVSDAVSWKTAALLEPLSCIVAALRNVVLRPGHAGAVIGAGPMGLLAVSVLAASGMRPLVCFEPSEVRRELALQCGATHVAEPDQLTLSGWRSETGLEEGADIVFEAAGHLLAEAVDLATDLGSVIQLGYNTGAVVPLRPRDLVDRQVRIIGVQGNEHAFLEAIDIVERGLVDGNAVVTDEVGLDDFDESLARLRSARAGKILLAPSR